MKNTTCFIVLSVCTLLSTNSYAQEEMPKWRFGVGIGVNALKLGKESGFALLNRVETTLKHKGPRSSFQGQFRAAYYLHKNWRLLTGLGLTHAKAKAYRKTVTYQIFTPTITLTDTVSQKYLFADLPIFIRWQIIAMENEKLSGIKPFIDFGLSLKLSIINKSAYQRKQYTEPLVSGPPFTEFFSGKLNQKLPSFYFAFGCVAGEHFTVAISWTGIHAQDAEGGEARFNSLLSSLMVSRFF